MPCLAVFNQKGGVGKTTTALNLAAAIACAGNKPVTLDLDPQGHLTALAGLENVESGSSIYAFYREQRRLAELIRQAPGRWAHIPAHADLAKVDTQFGKGPNILNRLRLGIVKEQFPATQQAVVMDCSPMLGVLSLSAIFAADKVLVPISADYLAVRGAMQVEKTLNALTVLLKRRMPRRYLITRFDSRRRMSWDIDKTLRECFGADVCETRIAESVSLAESPFARTDVFSHAPGSRGARDYQELYEELQMADFLPLAETAPDQRPDTLARSLIASAQQKAASKVL